MTPCRSFPRLLRCEIKTSGIILTSEKRNTVSHWKSRRHDIGMSSSFHQEHQQHRNQRSALDKLYAIDAVLSMVFGLVALTAPHVFIAQLAGGSYNHAVHETLRLYACLRLACGWILWHIRKIDDGLFRRHVCEALLVCYVLQSLVVLRAQFTERHIFINWVAIGILGSLATAYGSFRFGKGGNLIKVYELPTSSVLR